MSSEMREVDQLGFALQRLLTPKQWEQEAITYRLNAIRALLARTEAGADGVAEPFGYFDSQGLSHAGNSTNFRWLLEQHREGKPNWGNLKLLYTHPQDASGDAEIAVAALREIYETGMYPEGHTLAGEHAYKGEYHADCIGIAERALVAMQAKEAK